MHIRPPSRFDRVTPNASIRERRRRRRPMLVGSLLLHTLLLAAIVWMLQPGPEGDSQPLPEPSSFDMVFQGGAAKPSSMAHTPNVKPSTAPGDVAAPPKPVPQPTQQPEAPPPPAPEAPTPPAPETAPPTPPPQPAPPKPAPPAPPVPPRVELPPPPLPAPLSIPVPQPPPTPAPPRPRPPVAARPVQPAEPRSPSGFPRPQNYSFGTPSRPTQLGGLGDAPQTAGPYQPAPRITGAQLGRDWINAYSAWVQRHLYYPQQAADNGEDGTAEVLLTVDRYGRVQSVELVGRSGSQWLDLAIQGMFRRQIVPPFPPDTKENSATVDQTIHYILRR